MDNKTRTRHFLTVLAFVLWGMAAIIVTAAVLNAGYRCFTAAVAVLNLLATGYAIYKHIKAIYNEED